MKRDIVVGIPTYREADTIARSVTQIDCGLERSYGAENCLIVNVDNDSDDQTRDVFLGTETKCPKEYISTGDNPRGKGKNLLRLMQRALELDAKYVATLDADVVTMTPEWPTNLLEPLMSRDADYVLPIYTRNRFEGSTTNHFAFPLLYGVYGAYLRQPIGGEFGISRKLMEYLLSREVIQTTTQYGIDMFMTCHAVAGGFLCQEVFLGRKLHKPSFPKIAPMFAQIASSALHVTCGYREKFVNHCMPSTVVSAEHCGIDSEQKQSSPDAIAELVANARNDFAKASTGFLGEIHKEIAEAVKADKPEISSRLWAHFLARCTHKTLTEDLSDSGITQIVEVITPVFLCRAATLWRSAGAMEPAAVEWEIRNQAELFRQELASLRSK
jgi:hypothetical protein